MVALGRGLIESMTSARMIGTAWHLGSSEPAVYRSEARRCAPKLQSASFQFSNGFSRQGWWLARAEDAPRNALEAILAIILIAESWLMLSALKIFYINVKSKITRDFFGKYV